MKKLLLFVLMMLSSVARADFISKTVVTDLGGHFYYQLDSVGRQTVYFSQELLKLLPADTQNEYFKAGIGVFPLSEYYETRLAAATNTTDRRTLDDLQNQVTDLGEDAIVSGIVCVAVASGCGAAATNPGTYILVYGSCIAAAGTCWQAMKAIDKWKKARNLYWEAKKGFVDTTVAPDMSFGNGFGSPMVPTGSAKPKKVPEGTTVSTECPPENPDCVLD